MFAFKHNFGLLVIINFESTDFSISHSMTLGSQKVEISVISRSNRILLILLLPGNISSDLRTHINITSTADAISMYSRWKLLYIALIYLHIVIEKQSQAAVRWL